MDEFDTSEGLLAGSLPPQWTPRASLAPTPPSAVPLLALQGAPGMVGAPILRVPASSASATAPATRQGSSPLTGAPTTPHPGGGSFMDSLAMIESGNRNIPSGVDPDVAGPGSRSQGFFQINTPTWGDFAPKAGVDLTKYPNAMSAPRDVQARVAAAIPLARFGPRTQRMLREQFGELPQGATIGELAAAHSQGGGVMASVAGASAPAQSAEAPASPAGLFRDEMKLQLLRGMFPQHSITSVEYDPFKYVPQLGGGVDVNRGVG